MFSKDISFNCSNQSEQDLNNWQMKLHLDRMKINKHYDCFPQYTYNTAFGSLLTGLNCINKTVDIDNKSIANDQPYTQNTFDNISCQTDDYSTRLLYSSTSNDVCYFQEQQSIIDIIKKLIHFLDEFLLYLSSIVTSEQFQSYVQLKKMKDIAERIYEFRFVLLTHIDNVYGNMINSITFDISSISSILRKLALVIHCLNKEQREETLIDSPQNMVFSQLLERLERIIQSCMDCVNKCSNPQPLQSTIPVTNPCINSPNLVDNSILRLHVTLHVMTIVYENNHVFGLVYGIKDRNIRRKLGYGISKDTSLSRTKQISRNKSKQKYRNSSMRKKQINDDNNLQWHIDSPNDQISISRQSSSISIKGKLGTTRKKKKKRSTNSIFSNQRKLTNSSHILSPQQSFQFDSIHDNSIRSNSSEQISIFSDHHKLRRTSSHPDRQRSNIHRDDSKLALSSPLSSQSLSPVSNKSINSHRSREIVLSKKNSAVNNVKETETTSNTIRQYDEEYLNQINTDFNDSSITSKSTKNFLDNESLLKNTWIQRLTSPSSVTSSQLVENIPLKSNIIRPISSQQHSSNESINDFYSSNYSEHEISPSISIQTKPNDHILSLKVIEGPKSEEGEKKILNISNNDENSLSKPYLLSINTQKQQSTSATCESNASLSLVQFLQQKQDNLNNYKTMNASSQLQKRGYLKKFMNCLRRTMINRTDLSKH
ncbi:hypothetical protein I4U23_009447 [Adineta vaga]|nr:hypothetical protein I4U23_009447 [Adineta vaga]